MTKNVGVGYSLFFSGSCTSLTSWGTGVQGTWTTGNIWVLTVSVPAGQDLQWKVRDGTTGGTGNTWESGSNHDIPNPTNGGVYTATFNGGF